MKGIAARSRLGQALLVAFLLGVVSAFVLVYPRRMTVSAPELRRYWFGCTLLLIFAFGFLVAAWDYTFIAGALAAAVLSAGAGAALLQWWRANRGVRDLVPSQAAATRS